MVTDKPGVIEPGHLYVESEVQERLRMGDTSWKRFVTEEDLVIVRQGRNRYVFADDLLSAFQELKERVRKQGES